MRLLDFILVNPGRFGILGAIGWTAPYFRPILSNVTSLAAVHRELGMEMLTLGFLWKAACLIYRWHTGWHDTASVRQSAF
jgi:hypothetical protein